MPQPPPRSTLFPYTTLFRSRRAGSPPRSRPAPRTPGPRHTRRRWPAGSAHTGCGSSRCAQRSTRPGAASRWRAQHYFLPPPDRKSTRLNSSHVRISYAVFCLNAPATTEIYTLSLHDALPISSRRIAASFSSSTSNAGSTPHSAALARRICAHRLWIVPMRAAFNSAWRCVQMASAALFPASARSEEHTSELQSRPHLVCRLLLECPSHHRDLHSFPTRRSSDLVAQDRRLVLVQHLERRVHATLGGVGPQDLRTQAVDRPDARSVQLGLALRPDGERSTISCLRQIGRAHV